MFTFNKTSALCVDGVKRAFHQTGEADTFFSVPGFVYAKGARVYGYLSKDTEADGETEVFKFNAYLYRKNHGLIVAPAAEQAATPLVDVLV